MTVERDRVAEALEQGYTLPAGWYTDPEVLRLEQERIFRRSWQYAGRADQVTKPGDYFTCRAGDVPIVVVRDEEGTLRAFVNVCRHRGSEVVLGDGSRKTLQCHYHAWTYGLDGTLRSAPRAEREPGFDRSGLSLLPAAVGTWGLFVFVNPDADAAPLAETLGELPAIVEGGGIPIDDLRFHVRLEYELECNWKVAVENYLECYHCAVAHPGFSSVVDVAPDAYTLETHELFSSQFGHVRESARSGNGDRPYDPSGEVEGQFHFLWPNFKLNVMPGRPNVSAGPVLPAGPERTWGYLDYFFAEDMSDEAINDLMAFDDQVGREDRVLVESVQRGLRSGMLERGRLMPESEKLIRHFETLVAGALATPPADERV